MPGEGSILLKANPLASGSYLVSGNTVTGATGIGIGLEPKGFSGTGPCGSNTARVTVRANTAIGNGGQGIVTQNLPNPTLPDSNVVEVTDGGGNRASGNAVNPQCVVVVCAP